jgi:multidrug efflux pump subunit AcrB
MSSDRLKPNLMTILTTVLGVISMAIGLGEGSAMKKEEQKNLVNKKLLKKIIF